MRAVRKSSTLPLLLALALASVVSPSRAAAQDAVVHAVLFYSPSCPHCHEVMTEDLPPLADKYGDRLQIIGVDVTTRRGQALLRATVDHFGIPEGDVGVPLMVVGEEFMIGAVDIPGRLPGIIDHALANEGVDWPGVGALREALAAEGLLQEAEPESDTAAASAPAAPAPTPEAAEPPLEARTEPSVAPPPPAAAPSAAPPPGLTGSLTPEAAEGAAAGVLTRLQRDPLGNAVAILVLLGLVGTLALSLRMAGARDTSARPMPSWLVPSLSVLGTGVAAYLSFVEMTGQSAVCGPVGDCNAVQQSPYAHLFGVLPVGLLGLLGYLAILAAWGLERTGPRAVRVPTLRLRWAMTFVATAFSVYLTFLEPFVIGATCMWCITSSVVVGLLLIVTTLERRAPARA